MNINTREYIEKFLKIKTKTSEIVPLIFNEPQMKLYNVLKEQHEAGKPQRVIILKARQQGFSTLTEAVIFKRTAMRPNVNSGIVTHKEEATANLFNMSKLFYTELPDALKPGLKASNARELVFDRDDGEGLRSKIKCMTAGGAGVGRSDTFQNLHISEYAFWTGDKKTTLTGLLQAVPDSKDSLVIIESTANGYDDFKERWDAAVRGESDYYPLFCAWWELDEYRRPYNGFELTAEEAQLKALYGLDNDQIAWRRWCISNNCGGDLNLFKQEYPASSHEAFISTGTCVFDKEQVVARLAAAEKIKPVKQGSFLYDYDGQNITNIRWEDDARGSVKILEDVGERRPYVVGGDTSGEGSDYFVGQVLDNITGRQTAILRHQYDEDQYARQMYCLGKYYNDALVGIEANYSTYPIKELERLGYTNQFVREAEDTYTGRMVKAFGFKTTSLTRPVIIAELVKVARENITVVSDVTTLKEMLTFVKNEKGRPEAQHGAHDDCVMALAIAHYIRPQQDMVMIDPPPEKKKLMWPFDDKDDTENNGYMEW